MHLEKLLQVPKNKILGLIILIAGISFFLLTFLVFGPIEAELKGSTGYGVMEFEFAWTSENINKIFTAWGQDGINKQIFVTWIDFLYIPSYGFFFSGLILFISRKLEGKSQKIGLYMTLLPFIAGIFDVIENINLLLMLTHEAYVWSSSPFIASLCASIKFGLLLLALIFFVIALLILLIKKLK
ncbi:MAG: hypothetical protein EU532_13915 [Promethearchaeota archaeon]|nr:MAG: hypothetical protein EU532_13915 [Candidatus Lokiarchaeota archaeon]